MEETAEALAGLKVSPPEANRFSNISASGHTRLHNGPVYGDVNHYYASAGPSKVSEEKKGNKHWMVRRQRNALFTGQQSVLVDLEKCLLPNSDRDENTCPQYVLHGIGGVGKSEIALQFAHRHRQAFWGVFWIELGSIDSARLGFSQIANKCGWSIDSGENSTSDVVDHLSNSTEPWLLLLDNCDDPEQDYAAYFPSSPQGAVIMTTRLDVASEYGTTGNYKLDGLDLNSSIDLLAKAAKLPKTLTKEQKSAAADIAERLGHHALAITVAGSVLKAGLHNLEEYAQILVQKEEELLRTKPKQAQSTYGAVHATFEVSAQRLQECGEESAKHALELLGILAFLDRTNITEELFVRAWKFSTKRRKSRKHVNDCTDLTDHSNCSIEKLSPWHFNTALDFSWTSSTDVSPFRKARNRLHELSLINWTLEDNAISMHPLLHSWARNRLNYMEKVSAWHATATTLVLSTERRAGWKDFTYHLQRHLEVCFDLRIEATMHFVCPLDLCRIWYFFWWQLYRADSRFISDVMGEIERMLPAFVGQTSNTYLEVAGMRAIILERTGDCLGAIAVERDIVAARQHTGDPKDTGLRIAQKSLAECLMSAGEYQECIDILEDVKRVEDGMMDLGPNDRCATLSRLARAYSEVDRPQESLELLREVVAIREQFTDAKHPELLVSRHELGGAYIANGQSEKAVAVLEEVIRIRERTLSPEHAERLASQHELARAYRANGQISKALPILEHVVDVQRRTRSPEDARSYVSEHLLLFYYIKESQNQKARQLLDQLKVTSHLLSEEDQEDLQKRERKLLALEHEVAFEHDKQGRFDEAIEIMERVVPRRDELLAADSRDRHISRVNLLVYYIKASQSLKARRLLNQIGEKELLSLEHRVAIEHYDQGQLDEAIELMERVVEARRACLAAGSGNRNASEFNLLLFYVEASRSLEARQLLVQMSTTSHLLSQDEKEHFQGLQKAVEELEARDRLSSTDNVDGYALDGEKGSKEELKESE